jgi:hypothetical protein
MTSDLENQVTAYQQWRDELRGCIESYQAWLENHGHADIQRSLRIYDLAESLRNDRMILAFLAEFSRGKTELINAMFFSDFKQRLCRRMSAAPPCAPPRSISTQPRNPTSNCCRSSPARGTRALQRSSTNRSSG